MQSLKTIEKKLDNILQAHPAVVVDLTIPYEMHVHKVWEIEEQTGATGLWSSKCMQVELTYNRVKNSFEVIQLKFPNGKISTPKFAMTEADKLKWYTAMQASLNLTLAYCASDTYDVTPKFKDSDYTYRIHLTPPA